MSVPRTRFILENNTGLGYGAYGRVYGVGDVAIKKSRVSSRVQRPHLKHEARALQLVQGHAAIPRLIGYLRETHFEYIAMERLGPHLTSKVPEGMALKPHTVASIAKQMLSALEHVHSKGVVHRDLRPDNILLGLPGLESKVFLIDFGLGKSYSTTGNVPDLPGGIVGTLAWCSLATHLHSELKPRDDLESLAYILCYLDRGSLPWRPHYESIPMSAKAQVQALKILFPGNVAVHSNPLRTSCENLVRYARTLPALKMPAYKHLIREWTALEERLGLGLELDWTPIPGDADAPDCSIASDEASDDTIYKGEESVSHRERYKDSYEFVMEMWEPTYERGQDLTFPAAQTTVLDGLIPSFHWQQLI